MAAKQSSEWLDEVFAQDVTELERLGNLTPRTHYTLLQMSGILRRLVVDEQPLAHGVRLYLWRSWRTLAAPLVWILHTAYAWIVAHLALRALAGVGWIAESNAIHALTVGATGGLTLGMMTRTSRGHTARPLAADGYELTCFLLIQVAAVIRVFGGIASHGLYMASVQLSALLWAAAFGLFAFRYWPVLTRPRLDGKPG